MTKSIVFVGLDVHSKSISVATARSDTPAEYVHKITNDLSRLLQSLDRIGPREDLRCVYEAGPTGYGLYRSLQSHGIQCEVIAPSKIPRASGDKVKTDRRDAVRLAHLHRCGDLAVVHVPDESCEAMRDLLRAREDAKRAQLKARQQLGKFLLRHGRRWEKSNWTLAHMQWIETQTFEHPSQARVLQEYLHSVNEATAKIKRYDAFLAEEAPKTEQAELISALQSFRGIQLLTAASIAFELGDLRRFPSAKNLMSYLGLTPSEDSSGDRVRRAGITRAGNSGVRRLLVESSWAYRFEPRESRHLLKRAEKAAPRVREIAWSAQVRLHGRYKRMMGRGKGAQKTLVAVARELAGFIWAVGQEDTLLSA